MLGSHGGQKFKVSHSFFSCFDFLRDGRTHPLEEKHISRKCLFGNAVFLLFTRKKRAIGCQGSSFNFRAWEAGWGVIRTQEGAMQDVG